MGCQPGLLALCSRRAALPLVALAGAPVAALSGASDAALAAASTTIAQGGHRAVQQWNPEELQSLVDTLAQEVEEIRGRRFREAVDVLFADRGTLARLARERDADSGLLGAFGDGRAAKMFGMLAADVDLRRLAADVHADLDAPSAVYQEGGGSFFLLDAQDSGRARLEMVRQLTQALDDQHHDLAALRRGAARDRDALFAFQAIVRGSTFAIARAWQERHARAAADDTAPVDALLLSPSLHGAPPFVWRPILAAYLRGHAFLRRTNVPSLMLQGASNADIDRAFESPPASTEQLLHPVKYWKASRADEPRRLCADTGGLPADWRALEEDTLGELFVGILVEPFEERDGLRCTSPQDLVREPLTCEAAAGWGGDRYVLLASGGASVLHASFLWDDPRDAAEFHAALSAVEAGIRASIAALAGDGASGTRIALGDRPDEVLFTSWAGVKAETALRVADGVRFVEE